MLNFPIVIAAFYLNAWQKNMAIKDDQDSEEGVKDFTDIPPVRKSRCINPDHGPMTPSERTRRYRARFRRLYTSMHNGDYFAFRDACKDLKISKSSMLSKLASVAIDQHRQGKLAEMLRTVKGRKIITPIDGEDDISVMKEADILRGKE